LKQLGIATTCHLGYDAYHLFNKDWPDQFKQQLWCNLQDKFEGMLYAADQQQFDSNVEEIKIVLARISSSPRIPKEGSGGSSNEFR
jgi:hypothetical protein